MYSLEKIKLDIVNKINKALGKGLVQASDLIYPPNPEFGDLGLNVYFLTKKLKKTPNDITSNLARKMKKDKVIKAVKNMGPYLNFIINKEYLTELVIKKIKKLETEYGKNKIGKNKRVMIEYSNANTHKEYHVGHLRNICYGDAVSRILAANNFKAIPVSYINDFGIHVAKTLWYFAIHKQGKIKAGENKGALLGEMYMLANKTMEKDKTSQGMINLMMKRIESRKGEDYQLWRKTRKWSIDYFAEIYNELDIKFDNIFYESELVDKGRKIVAKLLKKKILKESEGAIIADLEKFKLGVLVIIRSDKTALYPVADMALAQEKFKKYKVDVSIYVVDIRQNLYLKQLFKILELMNYKKKMVHLGYEFVKLPSGMMSSRTGNIIIYNDLRKQVLDQAEQETKKRHKTWSAKKIKKTAEKITKGALKYEMIKTGADNIIIFDAKKALSFDGNTAAYLQYTYARINSILRKSEVKIKKLECKYKNLKEKKEHKLIIKLAKYPEVVARAGKQYDPAEIAKYLFELAQGLNDYYHKVPVLKAKLEIKNARLALLNSISQVIKNGLELLGIEVVEEM